MATSPELQTKVLDFIACTGANLEKYAAMLDEKDAKDKEIDDLVPQAVAALLKHERIEPHQKEAADAALRDPVTVLKVLIKTAEHRNMAERAAIGTPVPNGHTKRAAYNSTTSSYVGARVSDADKESTRALKAGLGLTV